MQIKSMILNFKPRLNNNYIIFSREERNGYITLKKSNNSNLSEIVNSSYHDVLTLCDGKNSIDDIIISIMTKYSDAPRHLVEGDVIKTIEKLTIDRAINLKGNPFIIEEKVKISGDLELKTISTNDFSFMKKFLEPTNEKKYKVSKNPFYADLTVNSLIQNRGFNLNKLNFIITISNITDNKLCGFLIWTIRNKNIVELQYFARDSSISNFDKKILKNGIALVSKALKSNSITYKIFVTQDIDDDRDLILNIKSLNFQLINTYKKEVNNYDIDEYQLFFGGI